MSSEPKDIVTVFDVDWDDLWYYFQEYPTRFAQTGHRVFYLNKILARWPKFYHFKERFFSRAGTQKQRNPRHENIRVVTPIWPPPTRGLRFINRLLIKRDISRLDIRESIFITNNPTYNTIDVIDILKPWRSVYINMHNYDDCFRVLKDVREAEKVLVNKVDVLMGDALFNIERLKRMAPGRTIYQAPPGVDYSRFRNAYRGDETQRLKKIYYFGTLKRDLNLELMDQLGKRYEMIFIGQVPGDVKHHVPPNIKVLPPVEQDVLVTKLKDADMIGLFYANTDFNKGCIPAKIFECMATGKPVLVCGLPEALPYQDAVYCFDGSFEKAKEIIEHLPETETEERRKRRDAFAHEADWENRFNQFRDILFSNTP